MKMIIIIVRGITVVRVLPYSGEGECKRGHLWRNTTHWRNRSFWWNRTIWRNRKLAAHVAILIAEVRHATAPQCHNVTMPQRHDATTLPNMSKRPNATILFD